MTPSPLSKFIPVITAKILEAGELAIQSQGKVVNLKKEVDVDQDAPQRIKDRNQAKTEIDEKVQEMLLVCIQEQLGTDQVKIDAEEDTPLKKMFQNEDAQWTIVIDPIDGTWEYLNESAHYSINVGVVEQGEVITTLIYFPKLKKLYYLDEHKNPYEIDYDADLKVINTQLIQANSQTSSQTVYVNNRVGEEVVAHLHAHGYEVVLDDGKVSWPAALLKCLSGEYRAAIFHTPQIRDVLLGALVENSAVGYKVDWQGNKIIWPDGGRIARVVFGLGTPLPELPQN